MSDAVNGLLLILCEIEGLVCYMDTKRAVNGLVAQIYIT